MTTSLTCQQKHYHYEKEFDVIIRYGGVCVLLFMWQQDTEYGQTQRLR